MAEKAKSTPQQVFLHLMMMATIIVSVISLSTLIVEYIDLLFPDELIWYGSSYSTIRYSSSSLLVAYPVFLICSWFIGKELNHNPGAQKMAIRRWLIYIALFIAALTIVIDLIQFVNRFYSGELTTPFFLKVLTILLISIATFIYFKWDLDRDPKKTKKTPKILAIISSVVLITVLAVGFVFAGSPAHQRNVRLDEERTRDLQSLESQIIDYWHQKETLPESLSALETSTGYFSIPTDPETDQPYTYKKTGNLTFNLCSNFSLETQLLPNEQRLSDKWVHQAGDYCFERTIDPDLYTTTDPKPLTR